MKAINRAQLYAAIPPIVALLVGVGIITDVQGVAVVGLAVQTVTLGFACYYAVKTGAPITRPLVYGFLAALGGAGVAWGIVGEATLELVIPAVMGVLGLLVAESNTGPHDGLADFGADGIDDTNPQRSA